MLSPPNPLVWLLCSWSDWISSLYRQGQSRERRKTRGTILGTKIDKSFPLQNYDNTKAPTSKVSQHYPKSHLSVSSLHFCAIETSRKLSTVESSWTYPGGPITIEHQWQTQNCTQSTPTLLTYIFSTSILSSCQKKISSVISWMLSIIIHHCVTESPNTRLTQGISRTS